MSFVHCSDELAVAFLCPLHAPLIGHLVLMRVIKKYPNRRLYDTRTKAHTNLADVKYLVRQHEPFQIVEATTNEDITHSILLQIILEQEMSEQPMFTNNVLTALIRAHHNSSQGMLGAYLAMSLKMFSEESNKHSIERHDQPLQNVA